MTKFITARRTCCARRVKNVVRRRWSTKRFEEIIITSFTIDNGRR